MELDFFQDVPANLLLSGSWNASRSLENLRNCEHLLMLQTTAQELILPNMKNLKVKARANRSLHRC
jgi:hypothetical protein